MKQYVEALQWLFGGEIIVQEFPRGGILNGVFSLDDGDTFYSNRSNDIPNICHLIDEALLKRKDVRTTQETKGGTVIFVVNQDVGDYQGTAIISGTSGKAPDPLTARLEALVKLKENQ